MLRRTADVAAIVSFLLLILACCIGLFTRLKRELRIGHGPQWIVVADGTSIAITDEPYAYMRRAELFEQRERVIAARRAIDPKMTKHPELQVRTPELMEAEAAYCELTEAIVRAKPRRHSIRYVSLMAILAVLPVCRVTVWLARYRRRAELRLQRGLCPCCSYDLRGTPAWCPECGWRGEKR